jgi:hypothetical protein
LAWTPLRAFWLWNAVGIDLSQLQVESSKPLKPSEGVKTELVLTALRACWLWNAANAD